jgi:hypothetical protein
MSETPVEVSGNLADRLNVSLATFTNCIGEALADICSYGLTIGETYVPFDPDDDDEADSEACSEGEGCNQAWVRVTGVTMIHKQSSFAGEEGCAASMSIGLEVGVLRCVEVPEKGEAPTATEDMACAFQSMEDMQAIYCAAMNCTDDDGGDIFDSMESGQWTPSGPLGGQYGGIWSFTAEMI